MGSDPQPRYMSEGEHLRLYVAARDVPCPACGYSLRGLLTDRCPECSQALRLRVGLVETRLGLWITGLLPAAFGAGFRVLLLPLFLVDALRHGVSAPSRSELALFADFFVALVLWSVVLACWIHYRGRFTRAAAMNRIKLVVALYILLAADVVVLGLLAD